MRGRRDDDYMQRDGQEVGREVEGEAVSRGVRSPRSVVEELDREDGDRCCDGHRCEQGRCVGDDAPLSQPMGREDEAIGVDRGGAGRDQAGGCQAGDGDRRMVIAGE